MAFQDRRNFIKNSGLLAVALGTAGPERALSSPRSAGPPKIDWAIKRRDYESLGPQDLIPLINRGQQWTNDSLIKYGIAWQPVKCCMRAACMPAEMCAYHYAMTGDAETLKALKAAVGTFRKYRHKARGRWVPYTEIKGPVKLDMVTDPGGSEPYKIMHEVIACHVGRNMRGVRAAAHVLQDELLLRQAAEELRWWIDNPIAFNRDRHFFDARVFIDEHGRTVGSERKYTMNMGGSLASAMWMIGNDLGDPTLMEYASDQIVNGIAPHQIENGYFPYSIGAEYRLVGDFASGSNLYHGLTMHVLAGLLAYEYWQKQPVFAEMMRRGARYIRSLNLDCGAVTGHPVSRSRWKEEKNYRPESHWTLTVDSALVHTFLHKYLNDAEALAQVDRNMRWLYHNTSMDMPFLPTIDGHAVNHQFRQIVMIAWEGIHLKPRSGGDVGAILVA